MSQAYSSFVVGGDPNQWRYGQNRRTPQQAAQPDYGLFTSGSNPANGYSGQWRPQGAPAGTLPSNMPSFMDPNTYGAQFDFFGRQFDQNVNRTNASTAQPTTQQNMSPWDQVRATLGIQRPNQAGQNASATPGTTVRYDNAVAGGTGGGMPTSTGGGFPNPNASLNREKAAVNNLGWIPGLFGLLSLVAPGSGAGLQNLANSIVASTQADNESARQKEYDAAVQEQTAQGMQMYQYLQNIMPMIYQSQRDQLGTQTQNLANTQRSAFQDMYGSTMGRFDDRTQQAMGMLDGYGTQRMADVRKDYDRAGAQMQGNLTSRGLGNSILTNNATLANEEERQAALNREAESQQVMRTNTYLQTSGDAARANAILQDTNYGDITSIGKNYLQNILGLNADEANALMTNYRDAISFLGGINHIPPTNNAISQWQQLAQSNIESQRMADAARDQARYGLWGDVVGSTINATGTVAGAYAGRKKD